MEKQEFGLLGKNISYSFSKKYFEEKFKKLFLKDHYYNFFDISEIEQLNTIIENPNLIGMNVTIPYKQTIIPFLDELSEEASQIGAVNCVSFQNGKKRVTIQMLSDSKKLCLSIRRITTKKL